MTRRSIVPIALTILSTFVAIAQGQISPDPATPSRRNPMDLRIDVATGRENNRYPPHRLFDFQHMTLDLDIPDMGKAFLTVTETLVLTPIAQARESITLDCKGPNVRTARLGMPAPDARSALGETQACLFTQTGGSVTIQFPAPVPAGEAVALVLEYELDYSPDAPGVRSGEGLTYSPPRKAAKEGATDSFPQIHSQGEAQLNSRWFICHDFPNDRLSTEMRITVEEGYEVLSNGALLSKDSASPDANGKPRLTWHWLQSRPHVNYLVALFVARCSVIDVGGPDSARPGLPMPVYCPSGHEDEVREIYGRTPEMIKAFEDVFGEPFPWAKYGQALVRDFAAGGMENTSATFNTIRTASGTRERWEDVISHELAHQWFGDLLTCASWEHIWLNEGFASYAECLWEEHLGMQEGGKDQARARYLKSVAGFVRGQRRGNRGYAPMYPPMVSKRYNDPDRVFMKADDPYAKGALVLHMLRERLGDEIFFRGLRVYVQRFKDNLVETDDLRRVFEEVSGQSLERFFDQWCRRPGMPSLAIDFAWNTQTNELTVGVEQTQTINTDNPAFAIELPVRLTLDDGTTVWLTVPTDERQVEITRHYGTRVVGAVVDPSMSVLARTEIRHPLPEFEPVGGVDPSGSTTKDTKHDDTKENDDGTTKDEPAPSTATGDE